MDAKAFCSLPTVPLTKHARQEGRRAGCRHRVALLRGERIGKAMDGGGRGCICAYIYVTVAAERRVPEWREQFGVCVSAHAFTRLRVSTVYTHNDIRSRLSLFFLYLCSLAPHCICILLSASRRIARIAVQTSNLTY